MTGGPGEFMPGFEDYVEFRSALDNEKETENISRRNREEESVNNHPQQDESTEDDEDRK